MNAQPLAEVAGRRRPNRLSLPRQALPCNPVTGKYGKKQNPGFDPIIMTTYHKNITTHTSPHMSAHASQVQLDQ